jgi:DNA modification methylase
MIKIDNHTLPLFEEHQIMEETRSNLLFDKAILFHPNDRIFSEIRNHYENFEAKYPINIINHKQFNTPVNFKQAKIYPRHRWYAYKEGFSPKFVADFLKRFSKSKDDVIFDPFGGIGTTVLESSLLGYRAFSNEINPLCNYIAEIKTNTYSDTDKDTILIFLSNLINEKLNVEATPPVNKTVVGYFTKVTLSSILKIQNWINKISEHKIKQLFNLAFLTILEKLSTHKKDGNGVKRKKNFCGDASINKVKELLKQQIHLFINDAEKAKIGVKPTINEQSSFDKYELEQKVDLVITSPPYANCFDYSKVYLVELWFGGFFKNKNDQILFRESSVISHVHYKWSKRHNEFGHNLINKKIANFLSKQNLWDKKIPNMLIGYFSDMGKVFSELKPNLNNGAILGFVVGNSVYAGVPVATDILLSEIAIKLGYELVGIEPYRTLTPSSQQLKIVSEMDKKYLRESLIILKWK